MILRKVSNFSLSTNQSKRTFSNPYHLRLKSSTKKKTPQNLKIKLGARLKSLQASSSFSIAVNTAKFFYLADFLLTYFLMRRR